jgi:type II secretory pathway component PulC
MTAGVTTEVASNASNLLMDIKPGYMLGAKPRQQAIGHCIGIVAGALASPPLFYILFLTNRAEETSVKDHVTTAWPVPGAIQWAAISDVIKGMGESGVELVKTGAEKRMVKLGDAVDGRTVESIGWDHVILAAGTERCSLRMHDVERGTTTTEDAPVVRPMPATESTPAPSPSGPTTTNADIVKVSDTEYVIERGGAEAMTAMQQAFMKSARVVDGKGIRLFKAAQSTVLGQLGLKRGDTVQTINGLAMSEPDKAIEAYGRLKTSRTVTLVVERGGKDVTITITIK